MLPPSPAHQHLISQSCWDFLWFVSHKVTKYIKVWTASPKTHSEAGSEIFFAVLTQSEQFSPCLQSCPPKTAWIRVFEKLILLQYCLGFVLLAVLLHHYYNFLFELTCQIFNRFVNKNGPSSPRFCCCWKLFAAVSCSLKTEFQ